VTTDTGSTAGEPVAENGTGARLRRKFSAIETVMQSPASIGLVVGAVGMVVALFLPWASSRGVGQGLAEYGAPQPAIAAWLLLAAGLATTIVAACAYVFGGRRAILAIAAGAVAYLVGAGVWYASLVLPSVVADGCNANGGPLCNTPATSPVLAQSTISAGLIVAVLASVAVCVCALVLLRVTVRLQAGHQ
jgi:hypothetical protein